MTDIPACVHNCGRDAEVRIRGPPGPGERVFPVCRYHAGSERRHNPDLETIPLEGEQ
jgi:hypothetical protein